MLFLKVCITICIITSYSKNGGFESYSLTGNLVYSCIPRLAVKEKEIPRIIGHIKSHHFCYCYSIISKFLSFQYPLTTQSFRCILLTKIFVRPSFQQLCFSWNFNNDYDQGMLTVSERRLLILGPLKFKCHNFFAPDHSYRGKEKH